jgi:PAS domain-containing protein
MAWTPDDTREKAARRSLCDRIVEETKDAVICTDRDGAILLWNSGPERIFGHCESEALGQSLDLIIPEQLRRRHWDGWNRVIETGVTKYGSEPLAVPGLRDEAVIAAGDTGLPSTTTTETEEVCGYESHGRTTRSPLSSPRHPRRQR